MTTVMDPDDTDPKQVIQAQLKIKAERINTDESHCDNHDSNLNELSQSIRPQQFYQDLDELLKGLPRTDYVQSLINACSSDYSRINDYRLRLAERARCSPDCPDSKLVNRRNSSHATKEQKCAQDCYILNAFINGERSKEIQDVFTCQASTLNCTSVDLTSEEQQCSYDNAVHPPDIYSAIYNIQAELGELSTKQAMHTSLVRDIQREISEIHSNFRIFHGLLNSIITRVSESSTCNQTKCVQTSVDKLAAAITSVNNRLINASAKTQTSGDQTPPAANEIVQTKNSYATATAKAVHVSPEPSNKTLQKKN